MAVDFITMTQLVDHTITVLQADSDIATFLTANSYGAISYYDNPDAFDPPGSDNVPFISIYRHNQGAGESVGEWSYVLEFEIGLVEGDRTTVSNVIKQTGIRKVEEFANTIYAALRDGMNCNVIVDVADMEWDETAHPLYIAYLGVTIRIPQLIGASISLT